MIFVSQDQGKGSISSIISYIMFYSKLWGEVLIYVSKDQGKGSLSSMISYIMFHSKLFNSIVMIYIERVLCLLYSNDIKSKMAKTLEVFNYRSGSDVLAYDVLWKYWISAKLTNVNAMNDKYGLVICLGDGQVLHVTSRVCSLVVTGFNK